jgi:hypothetical protein
MLHETDESNADNDAFVLSVRFLIGTIVDAEPDHLPRLGVCAQQD